jgi:hypothetical protein
MNQKPSNMDIAEDKPCHPTSAPTLCTKTSRMHTTKKKQKREKKKTTTYRGDETRNKNTLSTTEDSTRTTNEVLPKQRLQQGNNAQALSSLDR